MDAEWWVVFTITSIITTVGFAVFEYSERKAKRALKEARQQHSLEVDRLTKEALTLNNIIELHELYEEYLTDLIKEAKGYRNKMHRRAQRAEAERDRAQRWICINMIQLASTMRKSNAYLLPKYTWIHTTDATSNGSIMYLYGHSKDKVVRELLKAYKEIVDADPTTSTRID